MHPSETMSDGSARSGLSQKVVGEIVGERQRYAIALAAIRDFDEFQGLPIAPRETPTTRAMRRIAREALES